MWLEPGAITAATKPPEPLVNVGLNPIVTLPAPRGSRAGSDRTTTSLLCAPDKLMPVYEPGATHITEPPAAPATAADRADMLETVDVQRMIGGGLPPPPPLAGGRAAGAPLPGFLAPGLAFATLA